MKCTNCKHELAPGAKFCPECGDKVKNQAKTCLNIECGRADLPEEALFCPDCGSKLNSASRPFADFNQVVNDTTIEMIAVAGGSFQMGSNDYDIEKPIHSVTVSDFYLGKFPVTQKQWQAVKGNNPSHFKGENNPVENVSWFDAVAFCNKLSLLNRLDLVYKINNSDVTLLTGARGYRLPTEAEWEFAARGGIQSKGYKYAGSNKVGEVAEYEGNNWNSPKSVGGKKPNELGLYDLSGNVLEWCQDWEGNYSYKSQTNPTGAASGSHRIVRGGNYANFKQFCKVAYRSAGPPDERYYYCGFRLVLVP